MIEKKKKKHRRARGSGSVYLPKGSKVYWIAYRDHAGIRQQESSESTLKKVAEDLLLKKVGARENNLPVIKKAEHLTFDQAAKNVINDFTTNGKKSIKVLQRRIDKHLTPYFGGRRMAGITTAHVVAYVAHRQAQGIVAAKGKHKDQRIGDVSNAEINRELQTLKRCFSLAIDGGLLAMKPKIALLKESAARSGFFEADQYRAVLKHLPAEIQPVISFAYITGWRVASEVLPLEWRNVDFAAGEVRIDAGKSKNGEGRVFPMTADLRTLLKAREAERDRVKDGGNITPYVFFREVAKGRGGVKKPRVITSFNKAWKNACHDAGCPGRIPHDFRRTAVRNLVRAGVSQTVAMKMVGHKTDSVFRRYNIVSDSDLREAARKLDVAAAGL